MRIGAVVVLQSLVGLMTVAAAEQLHSEPSPIPGWPKPASAPQGAPNVVLILLDDIGFADTSTFGGVARTPQLDKLSAQGLRYNNFNTAAKCSPTRAALLTGRNHHRVGFGDLSDSAAGYPGYDTVWKDSTASVAEVLRQHGYSTSAFGKWHNTPNWEITPTGPFDRWPTGRGFEYFYGFMAGLTNQWVPTNLYRNTLPVDPPATPAQGYHFTTDITDEAIRWVTEHEALAPQKPYFLYFAPGAVHGPHHAPREWIDRYRGQFDQGWDRLREQIFTRQKQLGVIPQNAQLTPRPPEIPAWMSLSKNQQRLYARQMEVYAGFISHTDYEIGRLLKTVRSGPQGDNTLILYIVGDNGAAAWLPDGVTSGATTVAEQLEHLDQLGGPQVAYNFYASGWAWAGGTPFQYWKEIASHFGGVRDPMVVSWPARIKEAGALRSQFTHVTDVAATLYDVIGISLPGEVNGTPQQPLDGVSFAQTFQDAKAPSAHHTQYYEMNGNRAIYQDGWVAAARHPTEDMDFSKDRWELYHVAEDFSEARDLAQRMPDKVQELQRLFDREARLNAVYPLGAVFSQSKAPSLTEGRKKFVFFPSQGRIPEADVPPLSQSYRMSAQVTIPETGGEGVLVSFEDINGNGFAWYLKGDTVIYEESASSHHYKMSSRIPVPHGKVKLAYEFARDHAIALSERQWWDSAIGTGRLYINDQCVGEEKLPSGWFQALAVPFNIGRAVSAPVPSAFAPPFKFTGTIESVSLELQ